MSQATHIRDYTAYSDTVLYDVFFEVGTQLGAVLVELEDQAQIDGNLDKAREWVTQRRQMRRDREAVAGTDRDAQVRAIESWAQERAHLRTFLVTT